MCILLENRDFKDIIGTDALAQVKGGLKPHFKRDKKHSHKHRYEIDISIKELSEFIKRWLASMVNYILIHKNRWNNGKTHRSYKTQHSWMET